ncbi:MAG: AAA family ATPase, partial [Bacteroidales bacterium]|nr:AAA family ATPase [Bacteroidales bacterium]
LYNKNEILLSAIEDNNSSNSITIQFIAYNERINSGNQSIIHEKVKLEDPNNSNYSRVGLEISLDNKSFINVPIDAGRPYRYGVHPNLSLPHNIQYIRTRSIDRDVNGKLWDNITLSEKEKNVIEALKIIEKSAERINFIENENKERTAVIKLKGNDNIYPLKSMGDGINRILTIILALVNSDGGYLLIDEFENGLHYSIQDKIWEIIFTISQKLNIQVFITTHSDDCIKSFTRVLNSFNKTKNCGKLIRLEIENELISQVDYNYKELKIAYDNNIEVR